MGIAGEASRELAAPALEQAVSEIEERGWTVIPGVLSCDEADRVREVLTGLAEEDTTPEEPAPRLQRVWRIAERHEVFRQLLAHPIALQVWRKMLGVDMVCSTWTGIILHPGFASHNWHVDYPYWSMKPPYPIDNLTGQSVWLLDDFTEENGGTGVIPGSHRRPHPPTYRVDEWPDEAQIITGPRGSLVLANGAWWHCSRPNRTKRPRAALLGMYIRYCCIPQENLRAQLAKIADPGEELTHLLGGTQYVPR